MEKQPFVYNKCSSSFLSKMYFACGGGLFLDGYILVIIGVALTQLEDFLHLNAWWMGLIGAGSLLGLFVGTSIFGYITDKVGRRKLFIFNAAITATFSILQMFVSSPEQLVVLRFLLGVCVGADYSIGQPLLTEFAPQEKRGVLLGSLQVMWFVGAFCANVVGYLLFDGINTWTWMLGSAAIPALCLFFVRLTIPESPYWLANKGHRSQAYAILKKVYGDTYKEDALDLGDNGETVVKTSYKKLLTPFYLKRLIFCGGFYTCAVLPLFAIYTFAPRILEAFNLAHGSDAILGNIVLNGIFTAGIILGLVLIEKFGRRPLIIATYAVMTLGIGLLSFNTDGSIEMIIFAFTLYALAAGAPNDFVIVYPNELFPTEIRASGVGASTAISRIGAFLGTFAMPSLLDGLGLTVTMFLMTGVTALGLLLCVLLAPETKGLSLAEASAETK